MDRCIDSIVNSTYDNLEIILVDDGSPDQCGRKCDDWAEKDDRIKVIHKKNGGLSDARNAGIAIANGEYIGFVDSDDYIEPEMYEVLLKAIIQTESDISTCYEFREDEENKVFKCFKSREITVLSSEEAIIDLFVVNKYARHAAWNKLYKKDIFEKERFPVGKLFEDSAIIYRIFDRIDQIVCVDSELYHYVKRAGSITNSRYCAQAILDKINNGCDAVKYFKSQTMLSDSARMWCLREFPRLYDIAYKNEDKKTCKEIVKIMRPLRLGRVAFKRKRFKKITALIFIISPTAWYYMRKIVCSVLEKNIDKLNVPSKNI